MLAESEIELAVRRISGMDKPACIAALKRYRDTFPADLTDEFLDEQEEEKLRHLLAALCLHCGVVPEVMGDRRAA